MKITDMKIRGWPKALPFPMSILRDHEKQVLKNHGGQSLDTLNARGGLDPSELVAILEDRSWKEMSSNAAFDTLRLILKKLTDAM